MNYGNYLPQPLSYQSWRPGCDFGFIDVMYFVFFLVTVHFACLHALLSPHSQFPSSPLYLPLTSREKPWPYSFYPSVVQHVGYHVVHCLHFVLVFIPSPTQTSWWQKHKTVTISAFLCLLMNYKDTNIFPLRSMFLVWLYFALSFKTSQWWLPLNALPFIKTY